MMTYQDFIGVGQIRNKIQTELDVLYKVISLQDQTDFSASAKIRLHDEISAVVNLLGTGLSFPSQAVITTMTHIMAQALISERTELDVTMNIWQPPIQELILQPYGDAFIRSDVPNVNYGSYNSMSSGFTAFNEERALLGFDLTSAWTVLNTMYIKDIYLHITKMENPDGLIEFHETTQPWAENSVTWETQPTHNPVPMFSVDTMDINILQSVKSLIMNDYVPNNKKNFSMIMKTIGYVVMNTKESSTPPRLIIKYKDLDWTGFYGWFDQHCKAVIRQYKDSDLKSTASILHEVLLAAKAEIVSTDNWSDLTAQATISPYSDFKGKGDIARNPVNFPGTVKVTKGDLPAIADIKQFSDSDIISSATVLNSSDFNAQVHFAPKSDITGSVSIYREKMDLPGRVEVNRNFIDFPAISDINKTSDLPSQVYIKQILDLNASSKIRKNDTEDLPGEVTINEKLYEDLDAVANLRVFTDTLAQATIRLKDNSDLKSVVVMASGNFSEIRAIANIHSSIDLPATAEIAYYEHKDIFGRVTIIHYDNADLVGRSEIYQVSDIHGQIEIRQISDIYAVAKVKQWRNSDKPKGKAYIKHNNYLNAKVTFRNHNKYFKGKATIVYPTIRPRVWRPNYEGELNFQDRKLPRMWSTTYLP